ncbi:hypothetical protein P175DRAFT_0501261 [Aspergillus ochraceoroseus IBT 24754]|uniref:Uncharacterized protein n=1 Tax=Aspergillus ochraceoroseus IBT 24754 TaxID=1392256 RepID=A0A2T5LWI2_9EURO|nr:uncharacterized protein P175DRAFT_0501261 [Aspergillus ochraceoroseus IBT 24754]PTU20640.1 hypothetical protein P175DRAFT_0501261 [Aspergillus ochraceoroseus IBT 24754]
MLLRSTKNHNKNKKNKNGFPWAALVGCNSWGLVAIRSTASPRRPTMPSVSLYTTNRSRPDGAVMPFVLSGIHH